MKNNNVMGVVFANVHDDMIHDLTKVRSMASVPFGGRYRLIDFPLSNLVNAGVSKVGIIPKYNYNACKKYADKIELVPVSYLSQAIKSLFSDKKGEEIPEELTI